MHHRAGIPMFRLLSRYHFRRSSRPRSSFSFKSTTTISNRFVSAPISPTKSNFFVREVSDFPSFLRPIHANHQNHLTNSVIARNYSSESEPSVDHSKEIDEINLKFAEAREEIEMALESKETVYFDEEAECAREAVKAVLDMFEGLLAKMNKSERAALQRSMGLKIEQLKAELEQLND